MYNFNIDFLLVFRGPKLQHCSGVAAEKQYYWLIFNFGVSEYCQNFFLFVEKFLSKNAKSILQKSRHKIKMLNTHNLLCRKFAAVCRK